MNSNNIPSYKPVSSAFQIGSYLAQKATELTNSDSKLKVGAGYTLGIFAVPLSAAAPLATIPADIAIGIFIDCPMALIKERSLSAMGSALYQKLLVSAVQQLTYSIVCIVGILSLMVPFVPTINPHELGKAAVAKLPHSIGPQQFNIFGQRVNVEARGKQIDKQEAAFQSKLEQFNKIKMPLELMTNDVILALLSKKMTPEKLFGIEDTVVTQQRLADIRDGLLQDLDFQNKKVKPAAEKCIKAAYTTLALKITQDHLTDFGKEIAERTVGSTEEKPVVQAKKTQSKISKLLGVNEQKRAIIINGKKKEFEKAQNDFQSLNLDKPYSGDLEILNHKNKTAEALFGIDDITQVSGHQLTSLKDNLLAKLPKQSQAAEKYINAAYNYLAVNAEKDSFFRFDKVVNAQKSGDAKNSSKNHVKKTQVLSEQMKNDIRQREGVVDTRPSQEVRKETNAAFREERRAQADDFKATFEKNRMQINPKGKKLPRGIVKDLADSTRTPESLFNITQTRYDIDKLEEGRRSLDGQIDSLGKTHPKVALLKDVVKAGYGYLLQKVTHDAVVRA